MSDGRDRRRVPLEPRGASRPAGRDRRGPAQVESSLADSGVEHEVRGLVRGPEAPDDILDVVQEISAELVVIGLRSRSPIGKLLMGSNAQRILLESPVPVLAV